MGHHYVPRRYLLNFQCEDRPGCIWMFDAKTDDPQQLPIKVVAQRPNFYTQEVEDWLSQKIEGPANVVMEKLLNDEVISGRERTDFAQYVACMFMRVPEKRERIRDSMPAAMEKTRAQLPEHLRRLAQEEGGTEAEIEEILAQIGPVTDKLMANPPKDLLDFIDDPTPPEEIVEAIARMNWMMAKAPPSLFFITNDNPGFFYPDATLKDPESEVFLPLSRRFAFHACYEQRRGRLGSVANIPKPAVVEFNRRTARRATRHCFAHEKADWILRLMRKPHRLRPIRFPGPS